MCVYIAGLQALTNRFQKSAVDFIKAELNHNVLQKLYLAKWN